jgi:hypothetical protein
LNDDYIYLTPERYQELRRKERAHDDYLRAVEYMTGYMQQTKNQLQDALDMDGRTHPVAERMRGRIEAITIFDQRIVDLAKQTS